jgi:hypothetical protein
VLGMRTDLCRTRDEVGVRTALLNVFEQILIVIYELGVD